MWSPRPSPDGLSPLCLATSGVLPTPVAPKSATKACQLSVLRASGIHPPFPLILVSLVADAVATSFLTSSPRPAPCSGNQGTLFETVLWASFPCCQVQTLYWGVQGPSGLAPADLSQALAPQRSAAFPKHTSCLLSPDPHHLGCVLPTGDLRVACLGRHLLTQPQALTGPHGPGS